MKHSQQYFGMNRREWMAAASGLMYAAISMQPAGAQDRPAVTRPRATSGDTAVEPAWEERLTMTVGPDKADVVGNTDKAIQAAVDYVAGFGGGTVHVLPGEYRLRNAVYLRSKVRIKGSGDDSVLLKEPSIETTLSADSDWYDQEVTLADASGFRIGDGICLQTSNPYDNGLEVLRRTLVARSGNRFKLDRPLRDNFWMDTKPKISTLFPILTAEEASDIFIEDIALDGNRVNNDHLNGNYAGCIWMQDCSRIVIRGVTARNYNGDGISWQVCHDVLVENCKSHDHAGLGLHPGSGSQRTIVRGNTLERNDIGLFFCWGVQYGLAEKNMLRANKTGLSIGHRDNENLIRDNDILDSTSVGVLFRPERGEGYTAKGNRLENNRIVNSGDEKGVAMELDGVTSGNTIVNNELRETRGPAQRIGIRIGREAGENAIADNRIEGFHKAIVDKRGNS